MNASPAEVVQPRIIITSLHWKGPSPEQHSCCLWIKSPRVIQCNVRACGGSVGIRPPNGQCLYQTTITRPSGEPCSIWFPGRRGKQSYRSRTRRSHPRSRWRHHRVGDSRYSGHLRRWPRPDHTGAESGHLGSGHRGVGKLVAPLMLHLLEKIKRLYLQNCTVGNESYTSSFLTEVGITWRHSVVIYGRPIITLKNFLRICKLIMERVCKVKWRCLPSFHSIEKYVEKGTVSDTPSIIFRQLKKWKQIGIKRKQTKDERKKAIGISVCGGGRFLPSLHLCFDSSKAIADIATKMHTYPFLDQSRISSTNDF